MSDEAPTQPTLKTILEAINGLGVELHQFRAAVEDRFKAVEDRFTQVNTEVSALRQEMNARFDELDKSMYILAGDVVKIRARLTTVLADEESRTKERA
jgi:hypothetical protein